MGSPQFAKRLDFTIVLGQRGMPSFVHGLPKTQAALAYAERAHRDQRRKADDSPFILHPLEVAALLYRAGAPDDVIAAGALHDVIEKTPADHSELRRRFGSRIARIVAAVSEDERIGSYARRKAALREQAAGVGEEALIVLAADKISKARELRGHVGIADHARRRRLAHYHDCLRLLEERLPASPLVRELAAELEAFAKGPIGEPAVAGGRVGVPA